MADPFIGEIRMFTGTFAPKYWALCDGQILPITQYNELFALLGTIYGGDGRSSFGLPDLRGRVPIHQGTGYGLTRRDIGTRLGYETIKLKESELPAHSHSIQASSETVASASPVGFMLGTGSVDKLYNVYEEGKVREMSPLTVGHTGGSQAHINMQPFMTFNFIIALKGIFPSRN